MPSQVKGTDNVTVRHHVTYIQQDRAMSCWYAAAKMVFKFRKPNGDFETTLKGSIQGQYLLRLLRQSKQIADLAEQSTDAMNSGGGRGASDADWSVLAKSAGMTPLTKEQLAEYRLQGATGLRNALIKHGPLWCAGRFFPGGGGHGHVIAVLGVMQRKIIATQKDYVIFHDPAPAAVQGGEERVKQCNEWFWKNLYTYEEADNESSIMYIPA